MRHSIQVGETRSPPKLEQDLCDPPFLVCLLAQFRGWYSLCAKRNRLVLLKNGKKIELSFSFLFEFRLDFILCVLDAIEISYKLWFSFLVFNKKSFKICYYWIKERPNLLFRSNFLQVNMHKHIYTHTLT